MPPKISSNKRRNSEDIAHGIIESTPPKKQRTSSAVGNVKKGEKDSLREIPVIDLEVATTGQKLIRSTGKDFPRFEHGTVYIQLLPQYAKFNFRFKKEFVKEYLPLLFNDLENYRIIEADRQRADTIKRQTKLEYFVELQYSEADNAGILITAPFTVIEPHDEKGSEITPPGHPATTIRETQKLDLPLHDAPNSSNSPRKTQKSSDTPTTQRLQPMPSGISQNSSAQTKEGLPPAKMESVSLLKVAKAYRNLFLLLNKMPAEIDTNDINIALGQIELVVEISRIYGSLRAIHNNLAEQVMEFREELFKAILKDPPRWLRLSVGLECAPIFREAMIHIVGYYPHYPWDMVLQTDIPIPILELIRKKADKLILRTALVNEAFLKINIVIDGRHVTLNMLDNKSAYHTWLHVQAYRDWFCQALTKLDQCRHKRGSLYRLIAGGRKAYLDHEEVSLKLEVFEPSNCGSGRLKLAEKDLGILKDWAQTEVKELVVNNSMLDIEDAGIQHLTCIEVEDDELPWAKKEDA